MLGVPCHEVEPRGCRGGWGGAPEASGWWVTQRLSGSSTDSSPPRCWPGPSPLPTPLRGCATLARFYGQDGMVLRARNAGGRGRGREQLQGPSITPNQPNLPRREADGRFPGRGDPGGGCQPRPRATNPVRLRAAAPAPGKFLVPSLGPAVISINSQPSRPAKNNHRPSS